MWKLRISAGLFLLSAAQCPAAVELRALREFFRPDPFGGIVESDRAGAVWLDKVQITAARGGYAGFHLSAVSNGNGNFQLSVRFGLPVDLYREWFHRNTLDKKYYPDALIPVASPYRFALPSGDNRIRGQRSQGFWVDLWIPPSAKPGVYKGQAELVSGSERKRLPVQVSVLAAIIPDQDAVTLDGNSYGTSWLLEQYPKTLNNLPADEDKLFRLIHAYHRIFYEHRGTFHQLGYGHAGKVGPEFAPELSGIGQNKHVSSWDRFDRHYGPLLDGSAFRNGRRPAHPVPNVYLPVNPEWPASFLWWGEPGYEAEFVNVLSEMERHFREKNWTSTNFEVFFNQKKRYKGFSWDGDEVRFDRDNRYFLEYGRLLAKAVPSGSPVRFRMRADTSWTMARQFEELKGIVSFWVASEGISTWYPDAVAQVRKRGDIVWTYGGTPSVQDVSAAVTLHPLRSWISGVDGFVRWLTVSPGPDPWFQLAGGGETLVYSGERFGIAEPLGSVRLKLQRDCLQDLALLQWLARRNSREQIQGEVVRRYNGTTVADWKNNVSQPLSKPVIEWSNADIEEAVRPYEARFANLQPAAWLRVHDFALEEASALP